MMRESGNSHSIYNKRKITGSRIIVINSDQAENDQILRILERISRNILTVDCSCKAEKVLNLEIPDMLIMSSVMLFSLHNPWLEPEKNGIRECPFPVL
ncbi:MAG: hypothetical protein KJ607_14325, partial [Bacteroidetes bacterium]|nr:hypothetical protein [Bacteroidota bacterium]